MIRSAVLENLKFFVDQPVELLIEFCKLAHEYINDGPNEKKINIAAKKLETEAETIEKSVEALVCLLIDSNNQKFEEKDLEPLKEVNFSEDHINVFHQFVTSKKNPLISTLKQSHELRFRDLDWRLEAKVASRSLHTQAAPSIKIKLHLDRELPEFRKPIDQEVNSETDQSKVTQQQVLFETDPNSLRKIIENLENALLESKSHRTRNFTKAFQN